MRTPGSVWVWMCKCQCTRVCIGASAPVSVPGRTLVFSVVCACVCPAMMRLATLLARVGGECVSGRHIFCFSVQINYFSVKLSLFLKALHNATLRLDEVCTKSVTCEDAQQKQLRWSTASCLGQLILVPRPAISIKRPTTRPWLLYRTVHRTSTMLHRTCSIVNPQALRQVVHRLCSMGHSTCSENHRPCTLIWNCCFPMRKALPQD